MHFRNTALQPEKLKTLKTKLRPQKQEVAMTSHATGQEVVPWPLWKFDWSVMKFLLRNYKG